MWSVMGGLSIEPSEMSFEVGGDAVVSGCFVGPAAGVGIVAQCLHVGELAGENVGVFRVGDEVVALLADVGVTAGAGDRVA